MSAWPQRGPASLNLASHPQPTSPRPAPTGFTRSSTNGDRLVARRDPVGIRLITRRGNDWTTRYPLVVEAVNHLKVRSCLIDGEVACCDERGWPPSRCFATAGTSRAAPTSCFEQMEIA